ncbi:MAG: Fur family transcriptional regulator [Alphaproteobacteria bacterium]|nr:Fur family transcriptional regulator [Alphaproteobacteria bacterium]
MAKAKAKTVTKKADCRHGDDCAMGVNEGHVREVLASAAKPLSAYDIIPILSKKLAHAVAPATVYRALKHLSDHGIVTRIESRNAYVLCQHPHEAHDCLFYICRECGAATEAPENKVSRLLRKDAASLGFDVSRQILEIVGLCKDCAKRAA